MNVESWIAVPKTYTVFVYNGQSVTYKVNERYGNSCQQQKLITELLSTVEALAKAMDYYKQVHDTGHS